MVVGTGSREHDLVGALITGFHTEFSSRGSKRQSEVGHARPSVASAGVVSEQGMESRSKRTSAIFFTKKEPMSLASTALSLCGGNNVSLPWFSSLLVAENSFR